MEGTTRRQRRRQINPDQQDYQQRAWDILFHDLFWKGGAKDKDGKRNPKAANCKNINPRSFAQIMASQKETGEKLGVCGKIPPEIVVLDYDDTEEFECRLRIAKALGEHCIVIRSTHRGGHFYWFNKNHTIDKKSDRQQSYLTLSHVDYHPGIKKDKNGIIPYQTAADCISNDDGSIREITYFNPHEDNTLDEIPWYDQHFKRAKADYKFLGMGEGDGRNDVILRYAGVLKSMGVTYEQYKELTGIVNNYMFNLPMDQTEYETVTRQEQWDNLQSTEDSPFYNGRTFLHDVFASYLKEHYHIIRMNGQMHIYRDGIYIPGNKEIERAAVEVLPILTAQKRTEVLKYLELIVKEDTTAQSRDLCKIAFKNGVYDITTDTLGEFSPEYLITNKIPWNYNPLAKCKDVDRILDRLSCGDQDIKKCLLEVSGSCLYRSATLGGGMAAVLIGDKHNGKSTFIHMLETLLGRINYSSVDFGDLGKRFLGADVLGKLANLGDDISNTYIQDTAVIKKMVTGETLQIERKGQDPINAVPYATHIFSANEMPHTKDSTEALQRRLLFIPFENNFTPYNKDGSRNKDYDPGIKYRLETQEAMEYFILQSLEGLKRVLKNKIYTTPEKAKEIKEEYRIENDSILAFIDDVGEDAILNETTRDVYKRYELYCVENGLKAQSKTMLSKKIKNELGAVPKTSRVKLNGKSVVTKLYIR